MIASALSSCANFWVPVAACGLAALFVALVVLDPPRPAAGPTAAPNPYRADRHQLDLLAADAALGVDLVDRDVHGGYRGLADRLEDTGHHRVEPDDYLLRVARDRCRKSECGDGRQQQVPYLHVRSPLSSFS